MHGEGVEGGNLVFETLARRMEKGILEACSQSTADVALGKALKCIRERRAALCP